MNAILGAPAIIFTNQEVIELLTMQQIREEIFMWLGVFIGFCSASAAFCIFLLVDDLCKEKHLKERFINKIKSIFNR